MEKQINASMTGKTIMDDLLRHLGTRHALYSTWAEREQLLDELATYANSIDALIDAAFDKGVEAGDRGAIVRVQKAIATIATMP